MTAEAPQAPTHQSLSEFRNEAPLDFSRPEVRSDFLNGIAAARASFPLEAPLVIAGRRHKTAEKIACHSPSDRAMLLGHSASASESDADKAVGAAAAAFAHWSRTPAEHRAAVLVEAASIMRRRKFLLAGIEVFEAAKPWREADADIAEAIDFLEYYAREMLRLALPRRLQPYILGERNDLRYDPLGVVAVVGPWNFPLAIPCGMAAAAIVAGNTVVLKPAEQTPLIAYEMQKIFEEAGLPKGVLNFLPGRGGVCGARLVQHPEVRMVVFTGSRGVGLEIVRRAADTRPGQPFVRRVVAEMGGKNALIVDSSADLDAAVPDILYSAFGFAGQKCSACSRAILLADVYDAAVERLRAGVESLKVGPAEEPGTQVPAVIDAEAGAKIRGYIELGAKEAKPLAKADTHGLEAKGHFVPPSLFAVPSHKHRLAQEEIFGPVLAVLRARDFDEALAIANSTEYALTGGVHSRTLSHLERAGNEYQCGNLYLNRTTTGAIVGRQPFGGFRLSGIGSKAGGPDYLRQFLVARTVTENLMRHGFVPLVEPPPERLED
ncbi:MAG: L-glutamate gamma-semialdehyde dehydrogenase [Candidatus Sumerlaeia bacterium]|nr:L-glutamate gamma-semialdehyde dehydrogenase [Candidatus Sumerlaeia bacterium]